MQSEHVIRMDHQCTPPASDLADMDLQDGEEQQNNIDGPDQQEEP